MKKISVIILASATTLLPNLASGLVLWGLDNSANQTAPGNGAPWDAVAKITNSDASLVEGSAVYIGNGFMLTANHVSVNLTYSFVTFDQVETFSIDPTFNDGVRSYGKQVAPGLDLAVLKLTSIPLSVSPALLLGTGDESFGAGAEGTMVGWGVGRDDSGSVENSVVNWGNLSTSEKRWGVNAPRATGNISYTIGSFSYSYESIITYAGSPDAPSPNNRGLGLSEAGAALYDSGSGLFQELGDQWYLIGLTTAVQKGGSTTFGLDAPSGGDANYFARISSYEEGIIAIVPEPNSSPLLIMTALGAVVVFFVRELRRP